MRVNIFENRKKTKYLEICCAYFKFFNTLGVNNHRTFLKYMHKLFGIYK